MFQHFHLEVARNRKNIGWKHGNDVSGNKKKCEMELLLTTFYGGIFIFKQYLVGTRYDFESCVLVPEEIKVLMLKVMLEAKDASMKKIRLNSLEKIWWRRE